MKKKHNRPQKRLITQLSLWLALLLAFTGCAESTVTSQDNTYAIEQLATIPSELLEASETAVSEPESGQPQENASDTQESQQVTSATDVPTGEGTSAFSLREIPAYSGTPYTEVNGNKPYFTEAELTTQSFETYSELDSLGRCGMAYANVGQDLMPTEPRGEIGAVKPSGWHLVKYDNVDGKYLYNRCHLIAYMLAAENANPQNLITGTRYLNVQGMLPFETKVCDYVKNTGNHVLYRVTPIFDGDNLLADGVLMEAYSVEDAGEGICFCVFAYNVQPDSGPSLIFITLPNVFNAMAGGRLWGTLFFLFMTFASLSTVIAVFENIISFTMDLKGWDRKKAVLINLVGVLVLSMPCVLGYNVWSGITPLGAGSTILDLEDFIVSNNLLPLGSLVYLLFCTTKLGWGYENFLKETNTGKGMKFPRQIAFYVKYILPLIVLFIFVMGYYTKFFA